MNSPSNSLITSILRKHFNQESTSVTRFPTGLCHHVYDVVMDDGQKLVVRITGPDRKRYLQGALYWHPRLQERGIPVPGIIASNLALEYPYMIIERLPGTDLGNVYTDLNDRQKKTLAGQMVDIQKIVATLPMADGFGYSVGYEDTAVPLKGDWISSLYFELEVAGNRLNRNGIFSYKNANTVMEMVDSHRDYFARVEPVAFLDDITTKNVIVNNGILTGIVDTDEMCFGDSLKTIALTRMSLLAAGNDTTYTDYWSGSREITHDQKTALEIYTAMYCVGFMAETGMQFNRETEPVVDKERVKRLNRLFDELIF